MRRFIAFFLTLVLLVMALPIPAAAASCKHKKTRTQTVETYYEQSSGTEHIRIKIREEVCRSCGKVVDTWADEQEKDHDFEDGVCEDCGYVQTFEDMLVTEGIIVWKNGNTTVYVEGEETYWDYAPKNIGGTTMVPLTIIFDVLGGEFLYWDEYTGTAYAELDDDTFEYQSDNKYYWVNNKQKTANQKAQIVNGKLYIELKTITKRTGQTVTYKDGIVIIANNDLSSKKVNQIIDYLYYGIEVEEETVDPLKDIKDGKVYASSSDGLHLYKRVYDASKSCKYVDEYLCTLFSVELLPDTVFIQNGDYLYVDGEKVSALPDVLKQADNRVNQLKRIREGATNAYNNGVISKTRRNRIRNLAQGVINEYYEVARGEKTLSKVSEVKASYKAKVGDKNNTVEKIQQKLYDLGYTSQLVTGYYGDITFNNVAYFQIVNDLNVTGWVDSATYNTLFNEDSVTILEPENTIPYAYPTNLFDGMKVKKGWFDLSVEGNEHCDQITLLMYSSTAFNDGLSEKKRLDGNCDTVEFDCTDIGDYTLLVESRNNITGELFEYEINFEVVDTSTVTDCFAYFMLGVWDGVVEVGKGIWSIVSHPIESGKSLISGISFLAKALIYDGEEREVLYYLWTTIGIEMLTDLEDDEAKDTARKLGKFTAEIVVAFVAEKGIQKATTVLKESAKSGKLSKVSKAWIKTGEKADDFVDDLLVVSVANKFDDFTVIANKFPDEALPTDGFILATTVKDGKITGLNGLREADFVIKKNGEIIVGFRHTVLANGDDVLAAGRLKFDGHGKIRRVTNESGHYRPTVEESMQFADVFKESGLDISSARANYYTFTIDQDGDITKKVLTIDKVME